MKVADCPICGEEFTATAIPTSGLEIVVEQRGSEACAHLEDRDVVVKARPKAKDAA
jgi:hypothetical protein